MGGSFGSTIFEAIPVALSTPDLPLLINRYTVRSYATQACRRQRSLLDLPPEEEEKFRPSQGNLPPLLLLGRRIFRQDAFDGASYDHLRVQLDNLKRSGKETPERRRSGPLPRSTPLDSRRRVDPQLPEIADTMGL